MKLGIIILAAGESSRMGVPKQLLDINGDSMLLRIVKEALKVQADVVTVVLGAAKDLLLPKLEGLPLNIVENQNWSLGMSGSIIRGLAGTYLIDKEVESVLICTSDMPEVNCDSLNKLIECASKSNKSIIASAYQKSIGVPVLFKRKLFNDLLDLKGDEGARQIFKKNREEIETVVLDGNGIDLDTKEDYLNYIKSIA